LAYFYINIVILGAVFLTQILHLFTKREASFYERLESSSGTKFSFFIII